MKELSELFICPECHSAIRIGQKDTECACGKIFPKRRLCLDFMTLQKDEEKNWDSDAFDSAYEKADTGFEDGMLHAINAGIPEFAEKYRQESKERPVKDFIASKHPERLLDLGCGCGWFCYELAKMSPGTIFYGVDISAFRINIFKEQIAKTSSEKQMECAMANGEKLPFPDASFDMAVMREVLEHLQNPKATLQETFRILKPGGYLLITTPTKLMTDVWKFTAIIPTILKRLAKKEKLLKKEEESVYDSPLKISQIKKAARSAGYEIEQWRRVIFLPHESYLQFIPKPLLKLIILLARLTGKIPFLGFLGLHHMIFLKKPSGNGGN